MKRIITDAQREKIIELSRAGYSNRQIAIELQIKHSTLCSWKAKIRKEGLSLPDNSGRPKVYKDGEENVPRTITTHPTYITTIAEYNRMTEEEKTELAKKKLAEIMATMANTPPSSTPQ